MAKGRGAAGWRYEPAPADQKLMGFWRGEGIRLFVKVNRWIGTSVRRLEVVYVLDNGLEKKRAPTCWCPLPELPPEHQRPLAGGSDAG